MTAADPAYESIASLSSRLRKGQTSPVEITGQLLERLGKLDGKLHAFIHPMPEHALAQARAATRALKNGSAGPLSGIPYAAKDLFDVAGTPTTAGTRLLANNVKKADSTVVAKLGAAGMVLLGKTHTVQFAYGASGINNDHGTPHNPWHKVAHVPGGSSSGSAVAVASGLVPFALGTDTGGSVRVPAALCGIVGLKTTVGRVSRAGVYPLCWTLDSVGPITRTVEDAALVFQAMQGEDPEDASTLGIAPIGTLRTLKKGAQGLRVAFAETAFFDDLDPEVEAAVREAGRVFASLGAKVTSLEVPEAAAAWAEKNRGLLIPAEACVWNGEFLDQHLAELDPVIGPRMLTGRNLSAPDYFLLLKRYAGLRRQLETTLAHVDVLLTPTTMVPARPVAEVQARYMDFNWKYHRNAGIGNILDLCGVSLPCGFSKDGLPIGLQVYARPFREDLALRAAYAYEQATDWHERRPDLQRLA
jgi:aspartyl-tRNA(Asn)/glutamyl-tRNA(Gln) amidotransferase subunit A